MEIQIDHMEMAHHRDVRKPVAYFSARFGGIRLSHCAIIRHRDGAIRANPPLTVRVTAGIHGVWIEDPELYEAFQQSAIAAYRVMIEEEPADATQRDLSAEREALAAAGI